MTRAQRDVRKKLQVFEHARKSGNVSKTCRFYGISRDTFYRWKRCYERDGEDGLINQPPGCRPGLCPLATAPAIVEKALHLRQRYHFGPQRITWYLTRYHGIRISTGAAYRLLKQNGMNRLPKNLRRREIPSRRYEKQVPGHHVQMGVKFLALVAPDGRRVKRFQYTTVNDATRVRALKIYKRHTQKSAMDFVDYVREKFPFRIHTIRTDNGHEWQAQFHWHVEDLGIRHVYIKPRSPRLNGKVERSHKTDDEEFCQLLEYTGDVDLTAKLAEWERFYNLHRPHRSLSGKTPFEVLRENLESRSTSASRGE